MHTKRSTSIKLFMAIVVLVTLFSAGLNATTAYAATCTPDIAYDLYAKAGTATIFGTTEVNILGYSATDVDPASLPGPVLSATVGQCVGVTLHNQLPEATSLLFQGQEMTPDTVGAAPNGTASYSFTASRSGTFLYEAGLTPNGQHQVAMGLYGALVVYPPTAGQAYDSPTTAFTKETVLVLSEIDIHLNPLLPGTPIADPAAFDMRTYSPTYYLVNGKAYPGTVPFAVANGDTVLLRYVNAGLQAHAMSSLGLSQTIIAQDGSPYTYPHQVVAESIATGQTLDTLVSIPQSAADGTKYAIYDANMLLRNNTSVGFGGMLTFLTVSFTPPPPGQDTTGPTVTSLSLSPNPTNGAVDVAVSATLDDVATGNSNISAAEFYIDSTASAATAMTGAFGSPTASVAGTITTATLATLSSGNHTIYVRGQDSAGNWGTFRPITLILDKSGPVTKNLGLSPNPSSGSVSVTLSATGDDTANGNSNVTAAEYWVDSNPASPMTAVGSASPSRGFTATIPAGLSMGSHVVSVRSQDAFGNWGTVATISLQIIDTAPPTTSNVSASPNPNNGSQGYNSSVPAVRVFASFSDVNTGGSSIAAAEGFLDTIGTTGTGFVFVASDGSFNSPTESGYADIPLPVIGALSNGNHTIYVHAKDGAGNWGTMSTTILVITKSVYFSTFGNSNPPGVGGSADDADIYLWNGAAFSRVLDVSNIGVPASGGGNANVDGFDRVDANHFYLSFSGDTTLPGIGSVQDEDIVYYNAGTWSVFFDGTAAGLTSNALDIDAFNIVGTTIYFSTAGNANPPGVGGTSDDADIYSWNGTSFARIWDATAAGLADAANVDGFVRGADATQFYLSFATDTAVPVLGTVQDEDVVFFNGNSWYVYFDGTAKGLTSSNLDIDAFDIP